MSHRAAGAFMRCPHCHSKAVVRTSRELTPTLRQANYQCENLTCGCAFVAHLEVVRELVPSIAPNPALNIPLSEHSPAYRERFERRQREQERARC